MNKTVFGASTFCLLFEPWRQAAEAILDGIRRLELFGDAPQAHYTQLNPGDRRALKALSSRCELVATCAGL